MRAAEPHVAVVRAHVHVVPLDVCVVHVQLMFDMKGYHMMHTQPTPGPCTHSQSVQLQPRNAADGRERLITGRAACRAGTGSLGVSVLRSVGEQRLDLAGEAGLLLLVQARKHTLQSSDEASFLGALEPRQVVECVQRRLGNTHSVMQVRQCLGSDRWWLLLVVTVDRGTHPPGREYMHNNGACVPGRTSG